MRFPAGCFNNPGGPFKPGFGLSGFAACPISARLWQMGEDARSASAFVFCCHPDRSKAQRRDLLFAFPPGASTIRVAHSSPGLA